MDARQARTRRSLRLAFLVSLALHGLVLFLHRRESLLSSAASPVAASRLDVVIRRPTPKLEIQAPASKPQPTPRTAKPTPRRSPKVLSAPGPAPRTWSRAERDDMNNFLDSLTPPKPPSGSELARRGRAMAREIGREGSEDSAAPPITNGNQVDAFSMEMYFDAFVKKLNRSAAFVRRETRGSGRRRALVQITLNADGSLKDYKVLRAADQQVEIDFIRKVVDRASPFAAFPPDIRKAMKTFTVNMCITPQGDGDGFVRMLPGESCLD